MNKNKIKEIEIKYTRIKIGKESYPGTKIANIPIQGRNKTHTKMKI